MKRNFQSKDNKDYVEKVIDKELTEEGIENVTGGTGYYENNFYNVITSMNDSASKSSKRNKSEGSC